MTSITYEFLRSFFCSWVCVCLGGGWSFVIKNTHIHLLFCVCVLQPANPHYFHAIFEINNAGQLRATESCSFHAIMKMANQPAGKKRFIDFLTASRSVTS